MCVIFMAKVDLFNFNGEMPRVESRLLDDKYSTKALNCELRNGQIRPSKLPLDLSVTLLSSTKTIFHYNKEANAGAGFWFQFDGRVDVVRSAIARDDYLRTYIFGDGAPKITTMTLAQSGVGPYPAATWDLGIPAPGTFTATGPTGSVPDGGQEIETQYVITWISEIGEEGPPSDPTSIVTRWDSGTVELAGIPVPSGNFNIISKRIYRSEISGSYQIVADIPAAQTTYSDNNDSNQLGDVLPSTDWLAPEPTMTGAVQLPNGSVMGWYGNTLAFSEPYRPHAWPVGYELALDYEIVGAAVSAAGIIVVTKGKPYVVDGAHPSSMSQAKLDVVQACVSKTSVVDMGDFIIYASAEGLVAAGGTAAQLMTEAHITPDQWRARVKPESIHAYRYDDRYLAFYDTGTEQGAFTFSPQEGFRFFDDYADCGYVDEETGRLYVKQGTNLTAWNEGADATYEWQSKLWPMPVTEAFVCAKVDADSYPVTFKYFADGAELKSKAVASNKIFNLPARSRNRTAQCSVTGSAAINNIQMATSKSEIT